MLIILKKIFFFQVEVYIFASNKLFLLPVLRKSSYSDWFYKNIITTFLRVLKRTIKLIHVGLQNIF